MAIDICSENISSPRISFSHDLKETNFIEPNNVLNPTIDFDFYFDQNFSQNLSSADEIFSNGKILPLEIKKITTQNNKLSHIENPDDNSTKKRLIEFLSTNFDTEEEEEEEKPQAKPFWQFRRSSSLNFENGRSNNGLIRSLQFLTRSNSTGSAPNQKAKAIQKQRSLKEGSIYRTNSSNQVESFKHYCSYENTSKRASLKKSRSYGNGVKISPVLNIPPSYIAKGTVSLFGIGSLFCSKKSRKKKK